MGNLRDKLSGTSERLEARKRTLSKDDMNTLALYRIYSDLAREKKGHMITPLPKFELGFTNIDKIKAHPSWFHFNSARILCDDIQVDYKEWIAAQQMVCSTWNTNDKLQANEGLIFPSMLHGDGALERFKWFTSELVRKEADDNYLSDISSLKDMWQGPLYLATPLKKRLETGQEITSDWLFMVVSSFIGLFEIDYLITNPILGQLVLNNDSDIRTICERRLKDIQNKGNTYMEELIETRKRSIEQVDDFERLEQWL